MNETLTKQLRRLAWGWVILHLDFHLGPVNLLPDWFGYILILNGLLGITAYVPQASLLFSFGMGLGAVSLLQWLLAFFGITFAPTWLTLVTSVVSLYFQFQLLEDLATLSDVNECTTGSTLRRLATYNLLCCTILYLVTFLDVDLSEGFGGSVSLPELLLVALLLVGLIITIQIARALFAFQREMADKEEITPIPVASYKADHTNDM